MPQLIERNAVGKKPDWGNLLINVDQKKTPFTTAVSKGDRPTSTMFQWNVDRYATVTTEGVVDEADVSEFEDPGEQRDTLYGRVQKHRRTVKVSDFAENVMDVAGVGLKQEMAKGIVKKMKELKRDCEATYLGDNESRVGTGVASMRTRGLIRWAQATAQADLPVPAAFLTPSASIYTGATVDIGDGTFQTLFRSLYDETGDDQMDLRGYVGSTLKAQVSRLSYYGKTEAGLTLVRQFNQQAKEKTITVKVDVLETDFGTATLFLSSFINVSGDPTSAASKRLGIFMPMESVSLKIARAPRYMPLQDQGGGPRGLVDKIAGLKVDSARHLIKLAPSS